MNANDGLTKLPVASAARHLTPYLKLRKSVFYMYSCTHLCSSVLCLSFHMSAANPVNPHLIMWYQNVKHTTDKISILNSCNNSSTKFLIVAVAIVQDYNYRAGKTLYVTVAVVATFFHHFTSGWLLHKLCWCVHIGGGPSPPSCWLSAPEVLDSSAGYRPQTNDYGLDVIYSTLLNRWKQNEWFLQILWLSVKNWHEQS